MPLERGCRQLAKSCSKSSTKRAATASASRCCGMAKRRSSCVCPQLHRLLATDATPPATEQQNVGVVPVCVRQGSTMARLWLPGHVATEPPCTASTLPRVLHEHTLSLLELTELAKPVEMPCLCCNTHCRACMQCNTHYCSTISRPLQLIPNLLLALYVPSPAHQLKHRSRRRQPCVTEQQFSCLLRCSAQQGAWFCS